MCEQERTSETARMAAPRTPGLLTLVRKSGLKALSAAFREALSGSSLAACRTASNAD
jgi:hypothetical protein